MKGNMMHVPLTIPFILERCRTVYPEREIVSLVIGGRNEAGQPTPARHSTTYGAVFVQHAEVTAARAPGRLLVALVVVDRVC